MRAYRQQRGLTFISVMIIIAVVALLAMIVIKLVPVYLQDFTVASVVKGLEKEPMTAAEIRGAINKRLSVNNIDAIGKDDMAIERTSGGHLVTIDYEVRVPFVYNVDFVAVFKHSATVPSP